MKSMMPGAIRSHEEVVECVRKTHREQLDCKRIIKVSYVSSKREPNPA